MMISDTTFAPVCMCSHEKQHGCTWIRDLTAEQLLLGSLQGGYPPWSVDEWCLDRTWHRYANRSA